MAILFGSDNYPYDFRIRQLEQTFRQRQMRTIAVVAVASTMLTTGIGLGLLWLTGSFAPPPEPRSTELAKAAPSAAKLSGANAEKLYGCFAITCSSLIQNFETRPISLEPSVPEISASLSSDARPNPDAPQSATLSKADAPINQPATAGVPETVAPLPDSVGQPARVAGGATDETREFVQRARGFLVQGDIKTARLFLERAADLGDSSATFALAETYDPIILSLWPARSILADRDRARALYADALAAGVAEARPRISRLTSASSAMR